MKIIPQGLQTNKKKQKKVYLISEKELNALFLLFPTQMTELLHISKQQQTNKKTLIFSKSHIIAMVCENFWFHYVNIQIFVG